MFKDLITKLESSPEFKEFKTTHEDAILAHIFVMLDDANKDSPQIGYFSPSKDLITTFIIEKDKILVTLDQEMAKVPGAGVNSLDMASVNKSTEEIMKAADLVQQEHYKGAPVMKTFFLIQHLDTQVYNVTYFTLDLNTINIKFDMDLKLLNHTVQQIGSFTGQE